ncbi:autotransporter passenger strand-loop-strand repeat-containing protein [Enhydrobacter aerosaccus]|uniref:Autotransporter passenger strand-loop-strand repeat-containing protein n=1 Tax=Enhydrobacter aerosaccus TaxID=225324 RepID=A0A1T4SBS7_9HYPH|nr:AIDA repeat-containing protein [Enhydrobacter aerosaccus]SKA25760.1 autotransporter passenger strand-loop-strand repeat-containing protein [Enhydrobacter aerosaccus]
MPNVVVNFGPNMKSQLETSGVNAWAVYFNANGTSPTWVQLTGSSSATLSLPYQQGLKVYFIIQSAGQNIASVQSAITTESQITTTGTQTSAQALNYRYDSFEVTFTPAAADAGNLTDINGFGIPMAINVVYSGTNPITSASRGYNIAGGSVSASSSMWNDLLSAGGSASIEYFTAGVLSGQPRMALSPAAVIAGNISGTNYATSNWNGYVSSLENSTATSSGSPNQIQIAGYFNGAPDASGVWHNAGFYSYNVAFSGGNFVLTPTSTSQIQGTITISPSDLENSIYMTLGNATVSGLANPNGVGPATTMTMNTGANNEWGAVLRDFLAGFTAGLYDGTATSFNPAITGTLNLNKEWNWDPSYEFGGTVPSGQPGAVTPSGSVFYDQYAKTFFTYTNSYGNGYSDFLTRAFNVGPLINVSDGSGTSTDSNNISVTLYADSDTPAGYTPQVIYNYISAGGGYLAPSPTNLDGFQTTLNFVTGTVGLAAGTPVTISFVNASGSYTSLPTISAFGNYDVTSTGSGYTLATYGNPTSGVINLKDLPLPASGTAGVASYQITIGTGSAAKVFNYYMTVNSAGNVLNPNYTGQAGDMAIDGLALITGTGTGQYISPTSGVTLAFFANGIDTLDPSLISTMPLQSGNAAYQEPTAPVIGMRPGYTPATGAPFHELYDVWTVQTPAVSGGAPSTTPVTVYNGALVFGWNGADNSAVLQRSAVSSSFVSSYTNKVNGGDVVRLFVSGTVTDPASSGTIVSAYYSATADADGNWATTTPVTLANGNYTVQMQEFSPTDSTFSTPLNSASVVQNFTVAQGAVVSSGQQIVVATGQTSNGVTLVSSGSMLVSGGTANGTLVSSGGTEYVVTGTDAAAIVLGEHQVWSGGSATSTTIASGGIDRVYGTASAATVNGGGFQFVGGVANSATASGTIVGSGGYQWVLSNGWASGTLVLSGGDQIVGSGGFAMGTTIANGGWLVLGEAGASAGSSYIINSGTTSQATLVSGSATISGGYATVYSGGVTLGALLQQGTGAWEFAWSGGSAASTTVQSGTYLDVYSGGRSLAATVLGGGWEYVWGSGSIASNATVQSGGYEYVYSGGSAVNATIQSAGWQLVLGSGTTVSNTLIQSNGIVHIASGGFGTGITVQSGGYEYIWTGGSAANATVQSGGFEYVWTGAVTSQTNVQSGGTLDNFGNTVSATINSGGVGYAFSGGVSTSTQILGGGNFHVVSSGVALSSIINSGAVEYVWGGGTDNAGTINSGGLQVLLQSNSLAVSTTLQSGGSSYVSSGGTASGTIVSGGGTLNVFASGTESGATVNSGGNEYVWSGGSANGTVVSSGGTLGVYSGGTESGATVNYGGNDYVWSGGSAGATTVNGGYLLIASGGSASGSTITFAAAGGVVRFEDSVHLSGNVAVSGLTATGAAAIDFGDIGFTPGTTSASWAQSAGSGTLTLTSGALQASVVLFGTYTASSFVLSGDGTAGTIVRDPATSLNDAQPWITQPRV